MTCIQTLFSPEGAIASRGHAEAPRRLLREFVHPFTSDVDSADPLGWSHRCPCRPPLRGDSSDVGASRRRRWPGCPYIYGSSPRSPTLACPPCPPTRWPPERESVRPSCA